MITPESTISDDERVLRFVKYSMDYPIKLPDHVQVTINGMELSRDEIISIRQGLMYLLSSPIKNPELSPLLLMGEEVLSKLNAGTTSLSSGAPVASTNDDYGREMHRALADEADRLEDDQSKRSYSRDFSFPEDDTPNAEVPTSAKVDLPDDIKEIISQSTPIDKNYHLIDDDSYEIEEDESNAIDAAELRRSREEYLRIIDSKFMNSTPVDDFPLDGPKLIDSERESIETERLFKLTLDACEAARIADQDVSEVSTESVDPTIVTSSSVIVTPTTMAVNTDAINQYHDSDSKYKGSPEYDRRRALKNIRRRLNQGKLPVELDLNKLTQEERDGIRISKQAYVNMLLNQNSTQKELEQNEQGNHQWKSFGRC